jgi:uncharacterized protein YrrD
MIKASDSLGRAIVIRDGGREVGKAKDLIVDDSGRRVLGFVISDGVMQGTKVAPWAGIAVIGPDTIILKSDQSVANAKDVPEIKQVLEAKTRIRGLRLQTTAGKDLGKIEDFYFDEATGEIEAYQLAGSLFGGHSYLPAPVTIELGRDVAFIEAQIEATITQDRPR